MTRAGITKTPNPQPQTLRVVHTSRQHISRLLAARRASVEDEGLENHWNTQKPKGLCGGFRVQRIGPSFLEQGFPGPRSILSVGGSGILHVPFLHLKCQARHIPHPLNAEPETQNQTCSP